MHFKSIRSRVVVLTVLLSVVLVGGVTVATYAFVARGMADSAEQTAIRLSQAAGRVVQQTVDQAQTEAVALGLEGENAAVFVASRILNGPPGAFVRGLVYEGSFALHVLEEEGGGAERVWLVGSHADDPTLADGREAALESGEVVYSFPTRLAFATAFVQATSLGPYAVHVPVEIPGSVAAVLDVVYAPEREEAILNATRLPMLGVVLIALAGAVFSTRLILGWVLTLIEEVRRVADSIDARQLDARLPEEGSHEVAELAHSVNRLIDSLRSRADMQARFVADASHELATPVAGIRGYVGILRAWGAEDPVMREEALSAIDRESQRMARLSRDLLSLIRNEEQVEYRSVPYDMNAVCREVLANAATRYLHKQIDFSGPAEEAMMLYGDPDRVEELLGILVDNACKYTLDGGRVSVKTRARRARITVQVTDTGIGIPEDDLPDVFERFYRSDVSRSSETGGFGLGLAIAKHIVDMSGGEITVKSVVGYGTTFEITLPREKRQG